MKENRFSLSLSGKSAHRRHLRDFFSVGQNIPGYQISSLNPPTDTAREMSQSNGAATENCHSPFDFKQRARRPASVYLCGRFNQLGGRLHSITTAGVPDYTSNDVVASGYLGQLFIIATVYSAHFLVDQTEKRYAITERNEMATEINFLRA